MKKRVVLQATGKVQKVGYRDLVQDTARELGVVGNVENMRDGSVQIVCEGEEAAIDKLRKAIQVKKDFINVKNVSVIKTGKAAGKFKYFEIKYGSTAEELGERMGAGILYMAATRDEVKSSRVDIKSMHTDLKIEVKGGFSSLQSETKKTHEMLHNIDSRLGDALTRYDSFGKDMGSIRKDITDMKMLANEFREFKDLFAVYVKHQLEKDAKA